MTAHILYPRQNLVLPAVRSFIHTALARVAATLPGIEKAAP